MSINKETLTILWATSFGTCAFPGCNQELICSTSKDIIGNICHIVAQKPKGPRGDEAYSKELIDHFDNLILLCPTHHTIVDKDVYTYSVEKLKDMKTLHYATMKDLIYKGKPWDLNISQLYYLNIPRIATLPFSDNCFFNCDIVNVLDKARYTK